MRNLNASISLSAYSGRLVRIMPWGPERWTAGATLLHNLPLFVFISCEVSLPATFSNVSPTVLWASLPHSLGHGHDLAPLALPQTSTRYCSHRHVILVTYDASISSSSDHSKICQYLIALQVKLLLRQETTSCTFHVWRYCRHERFFAETSSPVLCSGCQAANSPRQNESPLSMRISSLGFVTSSYRTTHEVYSLGYIGLSNFMLIRCIILKIWRFEFFL